MVGSPSEINFACGKFKVPAADSNSITSSRGFSFCAHAKHHFGTGFSFDSSVDESE